MALIQLETFRDAGTVTVVIETPKGSRNKISYDEESNVFKLSKVLPEGSVFPYDFGFLPSTRGGDGDPMDVLVLLDAPVPMGCVVAARLIGVIEAKQQDTDGHKEPNHRLIAVAEHARTHEVVHELKDLRKGLIDEIEHFFVNYNEMEGRNFRPLRRSGSRRAMALARQGQARFKRG